MQEDWSLKPALTKKHDTLSEKETKQTGWVVIEVENHLPSKCKVSTTFRERERERERERREKAVGKEILMRF
jgi:hypothetical protein